MASNTYGGGPYFVAAKSGVARKDNGGTIATAGNANTTGPNPNISNVLGYSSLAYHQGYGSVVPNVTTIAQYVTKTNNSININTMTAGRYVIIRMCNFLGGVANTILSSGAGQFGRKSEPWYGATIRTRRIVLLGGWNYVTGRQLNYVNYQNNSVGDAADSLTTETFPTRAIPGKLAYLVTGKTVKTDTYKARND